MDWVNLLVLLFGGVLGVCTTWVKYRTEKVKYNKEKKDLTAQLKDASASIVVSIESLNEIRDAVDRMFKDTCADRFLILAARNGKAIPNRTTAIYEQHKATGLATISIGATHRYVDFQLDEPYKKMLKQAENHGQVFIETDSMDPGALKDIYVYEEVEASSIHFLMRTPIDTNNDRLWYCSVATHNPAKFSDRDMTMIKAHVGTIRKHINSFM